MIQNSRTKNILGQRYLLKVIDVRFIVWTDICNYNIHLSYPVSSLPLIRIMLTELLLAISKQTFSFMNNVYNGLFDQGCINPATTYNIQCLPKGKLLCILIISNNNSVLREWSCIHSASGYNVAALLWAWYIKNNVACRRGEYG